MRLGVNWTGRESGMVILKMLEHQDIQFCEILLDNFLHLDGDQIRRVLGGIPIAFHIMNSRFLEASEIELESFLDRVKRLKEALCPLYISDHIGRFTYKGRLLPRVEEWDYGNRSICEERICKYQDLVGQQVYIENFPSQSLWGRGQAQFYDSLISKTGCGLLFDISNAEVAEKNQADRLEEWLPLVEKTHHFHGAGYRPAQEDECLIIDSHDEMLSRSTINYISDFVKAGSTLVIERDAHLEYHLWKQDLIRARGALC